MDVSRNSIKGWIQLRRYVMNEIEQKDLTWRPFYCSGSDLALPELTVRDLLTSLLQILDNHKWFKLKKLKNKNNCPAKWKQMEKETDLNTKLKSATKFSDLLDTGTRWFRIFSMKPWRWLEIYLRLITQNINILQMSKLI